MHTKGHGANNRRTTTFALDLTVGPKPVELKRLAFHSPPPQQSTLVANWPFISTRETTGGFDVTVKYLPVFEHVILRIICAVRSVEF